MAIAEALNERQTIQELDLTTIPIDIALRWLGIKPEQNLHGTTVADLGAGGSPLRASLAIQGAKAFAIDFRYHGEKPLAKTVYAYLDAICEWVEPEMFASQQTAAEMFLHDYEANPDMYKQGYLSDIPLPTESVDITVSTNAIGDIQNSHLLRLSLNEAIRITKVNGKIVIIPLHQNMLPIYEELTRTYESEGQIAHIIRIPDTSILGMEIIKTH